MYELRPSKPTNRLMPIYIGLVVIIGIPVFYIVMLIVAAFLKGFLGF